MRLLSFLLLATCCLSVFSQQDSSGYLILGINEIATSLNGIIAEIRTCDKTAQSTINNLVTYQSGQVINVPAEIAAMPQSLTLTINLLQTIKSSIVGFFNLILTPSTAALSGPTFKIPYVLINPYLGIIDVLEQDFGNAIIGVQNIETIVQQDIVPLLNEESISSGGTMQIPQSAIQGIESNIMNIIDDLMFGADQLSKAANASEEVQASASFKASVIMKAINGFCSKLSQEVSGVPAEAQQIIASLQIQGIGNGEDDVNLKAVLNIMNGLLNKLYSLLNSLNSWLTVASSGVAFLQNPIGGALFNIF